MPVTTENNYKASARSASSLLHLQKKRMPSIANISKSELLTISFTLFAVIDILGSIPILISLKDKMGGQYSFGAGHHCFGRFMIFFYFWATIFKLLGLDVQSFAVAGSIVIFIIGLEMILRS